MIKPDAVRRGLIGKVVSRFEDAGLTIERLELDELTREQAAANYAEHEGKPFYESLIAYITSGPVVKMVLSGPESVMVVRKLMGATNPRDAAPGTGATPALAGALRQGLVTRKFRPEDMFHPATLET